MKLVEYFKGRRQRRARRRYEQEKAAREKPDEGAMDRVKDGAGNMSGGFG